jgi:hypothetical protein
MSLWGASNIQTVTGNHMICVHFCPALFPLSVVSLRLICVAVRINGIGAFFLYQKLCSGLVALFMGLLAIHLSSLLKHLLEHFAHFKIWFFFLLLLLIYRCFFFSTLERSPSLDDFQNFSPNLWLVIPFS